MSLLVSVTIQCKLGMLRANYSCFYFSFMSLSVTYKLLSQPCAQDFSCCLPNVAMVKMYFYFSSLILKSQQILIWYLSLSFLPLFCSLINWESTVFCTQTARCSQSRGPGVGENPVSQLSFIFLFIKQMQIDWVITRTQCRWGLLATHACYTNIFS